MTFKVPSRGRSRQTFPALPTLEPLEPRALLTADYTFFGPGPVFSPTPPPPVSDQAANSVVADFDNDGIPDLATSAGNTISFAKGLPDGSFEPNRTNSLAGPVGFISAGRFDGTGRPSLIAVGTRGGAVLGNRPNPGFRLRAISFDPTAHANINGSTPGEFTFVTLLDVPDYHQFGAVPIAVVGNLLSGWRDEFVINLASTDGGSRLAVFSFKNRSTIVREADAATSPFIFYNVKLGDVLGTGKAQIVYSQSVFEGSHYAPSTTTTTISVAAPLPGTQAWSSTPIRAFPTAYLTFALGDYDADHHTDIVVLTSRTSSPYNDNTTDSRLWLIRSLGTGAFAAPTALSPRLSRDFWSTPQSPYQPGNPVIAGLTDLNGDGRLDVLITSTSVWYYRLDSYALMPTAAIQLPNGQVNILPIPTSLDSGYDNYIPPPWNIVPSPGATPSDPPILLVSGRGIIRPVFAAQIPVLRNFYAYVQTLIYGQPSLGLPATFYTQVFDADSLRGGSIDRVEFYIDLNHDHLIDINDILVGASHAPDPDGNFRIGANVDASWGAQGSTADVLAVAIDNTGLLSELARYEMRL